MDWVIIDDYLSIIQEEEEDKTDSKMSDQTEFNLYSLKIPKSASYIAKSTDNKQM